MSHDLNLLESMEFKVRIKHLSEIIEQVNWHEVYPDMDPDALTRFVCHSAPFHLLSIILIVSIVS